MAMREYERPRLVWYNNVDFGTFGLKDDKLKSKRAEFYMRESRNLVRKGLELRVSKTLMS